MGFTQSFRMERAYFERLKSLIPLLKAFLETEGSEETRTMLENEITADGSILLLYRNLGEAWAELADLIEKLKNALAEEHELVEQYHDELNEKIDEVNNYIMALIREIMELLDHLPYAKPDYPVVYTNNTLDPAITVQDIALVAVGAYHFRYGGYFELGDVSDLEDKVLIVSGHAPQTLLAAIDDLLGVTKSDYQVFIGMGIRTGFYFSAVDEKVTIPREFCYFTRNDGIRDKDEITTANWMQTECTPIPLSNVPQKYPDETRPLYCYAEISFYIKPLNQRFTLSDLETLSLSCTGFENITFRLAEK